MEKVTTADSEVLLLQTTPKKVTSFRYFPYMTIASISLPKDVIWKQEPGRMGQMCQGIMSLGVNPNSKEWVDKYSS